MKRFIAALPYLFRTCWKRHESDPYAMMGLDPMPIRSLDVRLVGFGYTVSNYQNINSRVVQIGHRAFVEFSIVVCEGWTDPYTNKVDPGSIGVEMSNYWGFITFHKDKDRPVKFRVILYQVFHLVLGDRNYNGIKPVFKWVLGKSCY